ncbi:MAG: hypothetical protein KBC96_09115 [Armatimonadetes bacterium]|nr:hypothetical protein [Armatimonadota bacterium]
MIKCFYCGTWTNGTDSECPSCRRALQWSPFLQAILRPSLGCLMGARTQTAAATSTYNRT